MSYAKIIIVILNFLDFFQQKKIINFINKRILSPMLVLDIGAHHGETIKLFIKKLKIKKIYSFEASPINFRKLQKEINNLDDSKVEIFNLGIGNEISTNYINQTLETSSSTINNLNLKSKYYKRKLKILNIKNENNYFQKIPISIVTLDHVIEKNKIEKIDLLKIDTEGYELNVLQGLRKYSQKVRLIYFEHHYDDMIIKNYTFSDIHNVLKKNKFRMIKKSKMIFRKSFEYIYENQEI